MALIREERLLAEYTLNNKKTHSERLMPLIDSLLRDCGVEREELQAVAAAAGPGSFTGIRIGMATARGLAQGLSIPAAGVSTLEALAEGVSVPGALICPLLDARRDQVYSALYRRSLLPGKTLETLISPFADDLAPFLREIREYRQPVIFTGEGLQSFAGYLRKELPDQAVFPEHPLTLSRAALVALCGLRRLNEQPGLTHQELLPIYLRRPEAERRLEEQEESS